MKFYKPYCMMEISQPSTCVLPTLKINVIKYYYLISILHKMKYMYTLSPTRIITFFPCIGLKILKSWNC